MDGDFGDPPSYSTVSVLRVAIERISFPPPPPPPDAKVRLLLVPLTTKRQEGQNEAECIYTSRLQK